MTKKLYNESYESSYIREWEDTNRSQSGAGGWNFVYEKSVFGTCGSMLLRRDST